MLLNTITCRYWALPITNPCLSGPFYWSNNTIEPLSKNCAIRRWRNSRRVIVMGRQTCRSAGMRLLSGNLCTRRNESTRSKLQILAGITPIYGSSRGTPAITCRRPSCAFGRYSRLFHPAKHKSSQSNSHLIYQRNASSSRKTANWTKWWLFASTKITTIMSTFPAIFSPRPSARVCRRLCVVCSQVEIMVFFSPARCEEKVDVSSSPQRRVPRELWMMVDYLYRQGLSVAGLWRDLSEETDLAAVREAVDTGSDLTGME